MASWKKVIVSGSSAEFAHVSSSGNLDVVGTISAAAINGTLGGALTDGNGIADFTFNGSANATVALDLNGSTLNLGSSGVKVADAGITATQIATSVAGNGLTGGGGSALAVGAGTGIDVSTNAIAVDVSDFMSNGSNNRIVTATGTDAMNAESSLTFDGTTLEITGKISASSAITVDAASGFKINDGGTARFAVTNGTGGEIAFGFENNTPIKIGRSANPISLIGNVTASGNIFTENTITAGTKFVGALVGNVVGDVTGDLTGNADTATLATSITATANNTANETVYLTFVDGATGTQGIETDTGLSYNPNTGLLTTAAAVLSGQIQASTLKATNNSILQSAVASNISSSGYISASIFVGDGSSLTGVSADSLAASLTDGNGIADFTFDGSSGASVALDLDGSTLSLGSSGVKVADAGVTATQLATSVAGNGLTGGGGSALAVGAGTGIDVSTNAIAVDVSDFMSNGSNNRIVTATGTDAMNGEANLTFDGSLLTVTGDATVTGDLTVSGDLVSLQVTNLNVDDQFILMNSGSTSGDGGIVVQTGAAGIGTSMFYDDSLKRWGLAYEDQAAWNSTAVVADYHVAAISQSAGAPTGNPVGFGADQASRAGLMVVDTDSEDIYIFS